MELDKQRRGAEQAAVQARKDAGEKAKSLAIFEETVDKMKDQVSVQLDSQIFI